jgi:hypothetical protein
MRFYEFAPQPNRPVLKISQQAQPAAIPTHSQVILFQHPKQQSLFEHIHVLGSTSEYRTS